MSHLTRSCDMYLVESISQSKQSSEPKLFRGAAGAFFYVEQERREVVGCADVYGCKPDLDALPADETIIAIEDRDLVGSPFVYKVDIFDIETITENGWVFSSARRVAMLDKTITIRRLAEPISHYERDELESLARHEYPEFDRYTKRVDPAAGVFDA